MEEGLENCAHQGKKASQNRTGHNVRIALKSQTQNSWKKNNMRGNIESMLMPFSWGN